MSIESSAHQGKRVAILYDCAYPFVPGGGQKRLYEICRRLIAKGWQVDWYAMKSWPEPGEVVVNGIRFIPVAPARAMYRADGKRSIAQTLVYGRAIAKFPRLGGYDLVHMGQWPYFHFFPVRLFSLFGRARISVDWWEVWAGHWRDYYGSKGYLGMVLERLCAHIPRRLVAISETGARQLAGLGVSPRRIEVIHNGLDVAAVRGAEPAPERSDLIYLGRLQPHKNVNLLIEAVALLAQQGRRLDVAIIGEGPERAALEALGEARGVADQIRWLGGVESDAEVYSHLRASRVFVHPSTKEGGGSITSLEANAAGLPVVAFAVPHGISPELIEEGRNGCWVASVGASELADGIVRALDLAGQPGSTAACADFSAAFDWSSLTEQYHAMFSEMTGKVSS